jgi:5-(carboxyamino)imidazole ribonucleotide synthase
VLQICQHREREKIFLQSSGFPCPKFEVITSAADLASALRMFPGKSRLKSSAFGYDGKGQLALESGADAGKAWAQAGIPRAILEEHIPFVREISVLVARNAEGRSLAFPPFENRHHAGVLERTVFPARLPDAVANEALALARQIAEKLGVVGLLGVEMFELANGHILVNELAPRVHNSGHLTVEACHTSQFEQQIRAVCGLPFGLVTPLCPAPCSTCWEIFGPRGNPTGRRFLPYRAVFSTSTERPRHAPDERWATSPSAPPRPKRPSASEMRPSIPSAKPPAFPLWLYSFYPPKTAAYPVQGLRWKVK